MIFLTNILLAIISVSNCLPQDNEASMKGSWVDNSTSNRIIGGTIAPPEYQGYQVALVIIHLNTPRFHCGGSIISKSHVLTAAHCIDTFNSTLYRYIYGRIGTPTWNTGGKKINFKSHHVHPKWDVNKIKYDIGILIVQGTIEFTGNIKAISLSFKRVTDGDNVHATGWGKIDGGNYSKVLKLLHLKIVGFKQCLKMLNTSPSASKVSLKDEVEVCAFHSKGNAVCGGDSGGPLVKDNEQVGIVSWGTHGCATGVPDVYARISGLKHFITSIVGSNIQHF